MRITVLLSVLFMAGCSVKAPLPPVAIQVPDRNIGYLNEVKPVLEKRCVVCHSCYNSPCQLKLSSYEGVDRGASKKAVYNAKRLHTMNPTRLFVDAKSTDEWREKGFFSVTENSAGSGYNNSTMVQLLSHKMKKPESKGEYRSEAEDLSCSETGEELGAYLEKHPNRGMPFGFPPLTETEFTTISGWLYQGGVGPTTSEQQTLEAIPVVDQEKIAMWEAFFNTPNAKYAMTARYLYEHLFLAHISFGTPPNAFYELVRSTTAPGDPIDIIPTVRPYDDPGVDNFFYRFRKIHSTIVHKTHMVFELGDKKLARFNELFIEPEWLLLPHTVGYEKKMSANPFRSFEQIPPKSRYQFLLDNVHYIIMTFIRGPVCKGQVALNVIHDHFWLLFLDPEYDLSVQNPGFLKLNESYLEMPAGAKNDKELLKSIITREYRKKSAEFANWRQRYYSMEHLYDGLGSEAIWAGNNATDSPMLTVFRHFDSASVHKGALGSLPRTLWVVDYPLLERIYYSLVAGFDVYGTAVHQLATRVYMDELRQEGETYFIDFLPEEVRESLMSEWYGGIDVRQLNHTPSDVNTSFDFSTSDPKREFVEHLIENVFRTEMNIEVDTNYLSAGEKYPELPSEYVTIDDYIQAFKSVSAPGVSFFSKVADHGANLAYVRVKIPNEQDRVISVVINRWHDDVSTLFGEASRLSPEKDSAAFIEGFVGSYPNYFFEVDLEDLPVFLRTLEEYDGKEESVAMLSKFGVNRGDENFWQVYDWFQQKFFESDPLRAGVFDLNRYYYLAW